MLIYIFVVFIVGHCTAHTSWNGLFPKKLPRNFLPCASVGVKEVSTVYCT